MTYNPLRSVWGKLRLAALPIVVIGVTLSLGMLFHLRGEKVVETQLRERMLSTVAIAAREFDASQIERVTGTDDADTAAYRTLVSQLKDIRALSPNVRFAYIMRRTADPKMLTFVADADGLSGTEELDTNGNGTVDEDEEPGMPGDEYPIIDVKALQDKAFLAPTVDDEITVDQWGRLMSAYAPIADDDGNVVAVLGMDIEADDYFATTQETFSIVAVLLVTLIGVLLASYVVIIIRMRNLQSLKQLQNERSALLDLATHQLGMPLATFRWWLEILKERDDGKFCKRGDVCDQLQEGIDRMDTIIKALHEAGHLESNVLNYKPGKTAVAQAINAVVLEARAPYKFKKQKIDLHMTKNIAPINIEKKLFHGLLRELLENASSYSPNGAHVVLSINEEKAGVSLEVKDTGCGIPREDLPRIFEKFRRGSNATKYKPVGNGLGLFIVKQIIDKARGKIRITSVLSKGTTVRIFLPYAA